VTGPEYITLSLDDVDRLAQDLYLRGFADGLRRESLDANPVAFWCRVDTSGEHWLWQGPISKRNGYGYLRFGGKRWQAHRLAYTLAVGPMPDDLLACHTCDIRACCRPDHVFPGTHMDNFRDMVAKGRFSGHPAVYERLKA
jgi:hypothetical protein